MKLIVPDYYTRFKCLMGNCRHSCCKGWEIDIDPDTLEFYKSLPSESGAWILSGIKEEDGCASFKTGDDLRCPFLRDDGLCGIVLRLGMEALSDICFDHPVFRSWYSDRIEQGLGLCCESAGELILSNPEPARLVVLESDGGREVLTDEEAQTLEFRDSLMDIARNRSISVLNRLEEIEKLCGCKPADIPSLARYMAGLEMMDGQWKDYLSLAETCREPGALPKEAEIPFEQLLVYLLFRHTADAAVFVPPMFRLIYSIFMADPHCSIAELCRIWSSEIEYSDENPQLICEWLNSHI